MLTAITRAVSPTIAACQLTFREREAIDIALAREQHRAYETCLAELGVEKGAAAVAEPGRVGAVDPMTDFGNGHRAEHDGNFSNYFLDTLDSLIWPQIPALGGNQDTGVQN